MDKERRRNVGFALFLIFVALVVIGAIVFMVILYGEAMAAQTVCESQGFVAVQKALSGYVCVEAAR